MINESGEYQYTALLEGDIQEIQDRLTHFVIYKKNHGLGANGIDNYINHLSKFHWVNGVKGIDMEIVRTYKPEQVKTNDREYNPEEVCD